MTDKIVTEAMLPCPFCSGPVHRRTEHGVEGCFHIAMPHCPVASHRLMTVEQWNHRTAMSTAQEPALDDDAEWTALAMLKRRRADVVDGIAEVMVEELDAAIAEIARLQAKAPLAAVQAGREQMSQPSGEG